METGISFGYSVWFLPLCLLLGAAFAALLYYKDKSFDGFTSNKWIKYGMTAFRFITVSILAILLLSPFLKSLQTTTQKPIIAILQDNSESLKHSFKKEDSISYFSKLQKLSDDLSGKYQVVTYSFGDKFLPSSTFSLADKTTNISDAFEQINDLYYNQNLGAVILASDGIYNQGINPLYSVEKAPYSIYTVALGDTTIPNDLFFGQVYYNNITYLNDQFSMKVDVNATNLNGKGTQLSIVEIGANGKQVGAKTIAINSSSFSQSFDFVIPADKVGIVHYQLRLAPIAGEITTRNNVKDVFVEVLDGRQKILIVANSPHPDIAAIKQAVESNKNYQVEVQYADAFTAKIPDYNLIILHQLPSNTATAANIVAQAKTLKKSILYIVGLQTNLTSLNTLQTGIVINANNNRVNDATAKWNSDFPLFTISENTQQAISKFPPLENPFGNYKSAAAAQILFTQKINNVETDYPLWLFSDQLENKIGIIAGEGLWRWRMHDFMLHKNHDAFNEIINKSVQYLSVKSDNRPFRVTVSKNIFADNEQILFDAQLYNANFEMINTPDVDLKIKDESGKEFPFKFSKTENYYTLNAGFLGVGNYSYFATTKNGANSYKAEGKFSVAPIQLESQQTVADHNTLKAMAQQHKGEIYSPANMESLAEKINKENQLKPILYENYITESFINLKWIFFLLLLLLSAEWFLRKYMGGY